MDIASSSVIVVGGSRGLGLAIVEALSRRGAKVTAVARGQASLDAVGQRLGVATERADAVDGARARELVASLKPDAVVFAAGAIPPMASIDAISWEDFSKTWESDARGALMWLQAALKAPLRRGARFVTLSSGAAMGGSPLSGGYGGAKRAQWFATHYAATFSEQAGLGIHFQTFVTGQMVAGTGVGDAGSLAYAERMNITQAQFLERFGKAITPAEVGEAVVRLLSDPELETARAFRFDGPGGLAPVALQ